MLPNPFSSLAEHALALRSQHYSSVELIELYLERIRRFDENIHSYVTICSDRALRSAVAADERRAREESVGPLDGLPIAVKDLFDIAGMTSACGSQVWLNRRATTTAEVVRRLEDAGMCVLGKLHMVEFAFGAWGLNPFMGTPCNPWDDQVQRIPGGSSSGCGAAVAAGLAPAAIGSDTGGSVRTPAALNGITGLKTTSGLIDLTGALPLSPTLDSAGPMCRSAVDAALLVSVLVDQPYCCSLEKVASELNSGDTLADLHILVLDEEDFPVNVAPEIRQAFRRAQEVFSLLGATMENIHSPFDFNEIARLNGELIAVEAWNVHRDYIEDESLPIGYWVRKRVLSGKEISANHHTSLLKRHSEFRRVWRDWIPPGTVLLLPALPVVACPIDEADESTIPLGAFARAANFLGACGITFPAGSTSIGLPIALQLMSGPFGEAALLRACHAFQSKTKWHLRIPSNLDS